MFISHKLLFCRNSYKKVNNELIIKNKRNYGIDLLRIFSMINVINLHINVVSKILFNDKSFKYKEAWRLQVFSFFAVDCFGLISGYVGFHRYKFSNLIYLWLIVWFYSIGISLYLYLMYSGQITKNNVFLHLFPILIKRDWYVNAYFSMYLFLPFINYGINNIDRKLYRNIVIFFIIFFSIYNCFAKMIGDINYAFLNSGFSSKWLTILYIIGAYFGKYYNEAKLEIFNFIIYFSIYICSSFFSLEFKFSKIISKIPRSCFIDYLSPTMILQSLSLLFLFSRTKIINKRLKYINS